MMGGAVAAYGSAQTIFERYGGFATIRLLVMDFYERVLDSDVVGHHFDGIDMVRLIDHQTKFVAALTGGPAEISDDRLARAHRHLAVRHDEFDEVVALLGETLKVGGVATDDRRAILAAVEARRSLVVSDEPNRTGGAAA